MKITLLTSEAKKRKRNNSSWMTGFIIEKSQYDELAKSQFEANFQRKARNLLKKSSKTGIID